MYPKLNDEEINQTKPLVSNASVSKEHRISGSKTAIVQYEILESRNVKKKGNCCGSLTNWILPHSSIYLPFTFRGEHMYSTVCSKVMGLFFAAVYIFILYYEITKIGSNEIHNDQLVNYQNNSQLADLYKNVSDPYNNTNAPFYYIEGAGQKTCEAYNNMTLNEKRNMGVTAFSISPKSDPENIVRFINPLDCILDEDGDTLFKTKESDVQIYMSIINPQFVDGKIVNIPDGHRINSLFKNYSLEDLVVSNYYTFTDFKGLCNLNNENKQIMSHMNFYNNFINNDFDTNAKGVFTKQIQTLNTVDFANDLCKDVVNEWTREIYFMKQTTKEPAQTFLQKAGLQKLDASSTFQYDIQNSYGQNRVKNYSSNGYQAQDTLYFQDEYTDNTGLHTFYTRYQMKYQEIEQASTMVILGTIGGAFMLVFIVGTCSMNLILHKSFKKELAKDTKGLDEENLSYEQISKLAIAQKHVDTQEQRMKNLESQVAQLMKKQM